MLWIATCDTCDWVFACDDMWEADDEAEHHMEQHPEHQALVGREDA